MVRPEDRGRRRSQTSIITAGPAAPGPRPADQAGPGQTQCRAEHRAGVRTSPGQHRAAHDEQDETDPKQSGASLIHRRGILGAGPGQRCDHVKRLISARDLSRVVALEPLGRISVLGYAVQISEAIRRFERIKYWIR